MKYVIFLGGGGHNCIFNTSYPLHVLFHDSSEKLIRVPSDARVNGTNRSKNLTRSYKNILYTPVERTFSSRFMNRIQLVERDGAKRKGRLELHERKK